jgi:hypothetical protein
VLVQRKSGDAVDVVGAVFDVVDRADRIAVGVEPDLSVDVEEVDEV